VLFRLILAAATTKAGLNILFHLYETFFVDDVTKLRREVQIQRQMRKNSAERFNR